MSRFLYVVAQERLDLYDILKAEFANEPDMQVILDRRRGERRQAAQPHTPERRRADRRHQLELDRDLRANGSFITPAQERPAWA